MGRVIFFVFPSGLGHAQPPGDCDEGAEDWPPEGLCPSPAQSPFLRLDRAPACPFPPSVHGDSLKPVTVLSFGLVRTKQTVFGSSLPLAPHSVCTTFVYRSEALCPLTQSLIQGRRRALTRPKASRRLGSRRDSDSHPHVCSFIVRSSVSVPALVSTEPLGAARRLRSAPQPGVRAGTVTVAFGGARTSPLTRGALHLGKSPVPGRVLGSRSGREWTGRLRWGCCRVCRVSSSGRCLLAAPLGSGRRDVQGRSSAVRLPWGER